MISSSRIHRALLKFRIRYPQLHCVSDWERPIFRKGLDGFEAALDINTSKPPSSTDYNGVRSICRPLPNWWAQRHSVNSLIGSPNAPCIGSSPYKEPYPELLRYYSNQSNGKVIHHSMTFIPKKIYPSLTFEGRIIYCRTVSEVEKAATEILEMTEEKKESTSQVTLGLDIEWKPTFVKGRKPGKTAVIQICVGIDLCYVMHVHHSGIPPLLKSLLENPTFLKVGVGIHGDANKVLKHYNVCVNALEDLSKLANTKFGGKPKAWGLNSLAETLISKGLKKPWKIRLGNWEAHILTAEQIKYAAIDAFASWHLYQVLKSLPDADSNNIVEEV